MKKRFELPAIPQDQQTPLVQSLVGIIEGLAEVVRHHEETLDVLKDEIQVLKGEKKRPRFKPSKMDEQTDPPEDKDNTSESKPKRPGSAKACKTSSLRIDEVSVIPPNVEVPAGSRFKGYRDFIVQDLHISTHNTRYRLECWATPAGKRLTGQLPEALSGKHYGPALISYLLYQHHHCQVTQPLLHEQLTEWGISISRGEIDRLLTANKTGFHDEKDQLLRTGLAVSDYLSVDDSGARHQGKNGYVTQIGNEWFAWFASTGSKSRVNFLELLRAGDERYCLNEQAFAYASEHKLPAVSLQALRDSDIHELATAPDWEHHLDTLGITSPRHRVLATEAALLGTLFEQGLSEALVILSDDAGQFNILLHALCWIHTERLIHKLIPLNDQQREDIEVIRDQVWTLYADLKAYKRQPTAFDPQTLSERFDAIFTQDTSSGRLNALLKRIHRNKAELLVVLKRPEIPLHTNGSETDIRDYVKKRKVSGGTRSEPGRQCRDTFASLKKTCRKLGVSFWQYLMDRQAGINAILPLPTIVEQKAALRTAPAY